MGLTQEQGRPVIVCDKCCQNTPLGSTVLVCYRDIATFNLVCEDCGDKLVVQWKDKGAFTMQAVDYFNRLVARHARTSPRY